MRKKAIVVVQMSVIGASGNRFNHGGFIETHLQQPSEPLILRPLLQLRFRRITSSCYGCDFCV